MKYIWFLYLKTFGYAFLDSPEITPTSSMTTPLHPPATPAPSNPTTPSCSTSTATPSCSRKRKMADCNGDAPAPKRSKLSLNRKHKSSKLPATNDQLPSDSFLFDETQNSFTELREEGGGTNSHDVSPDVVEEGGKDLPSLPVAAGAAGAAGLSGNELYMFWRKRKWSRVRFFTVKFTIGLLYLGLMYTHQRILPSDLMR